MLCTTISPALHNQMHSKVTRHSLISQKSPTYPRYVLIDTSSDDNLQQNEDTINTSVSFMDQSWACKYKAIISMTDLNNL